MALNKPGRCGADIRGLKVKWSDSLVECSHHGHGAKTDQCRAPGWYVWVQFRRGENLVWEAGLELRFIREVDATRAASALTAAGLDSAKRMKAAGGEAVIRTAWEALAW